MPHLLSDIRWPTEMFFVADTPDFKFYSEAAGWTRNSTVTRAMFAQPALDQPERYVHLDGLNSSFMDGHARTLKRDEVLNRAGDANNPLWLGGCTP